MRCYYFSRKFVVLLALFVFTVLSCSTGSRIAEIGPPGGPISANPEAANRLRQNFYQSLQEASTGNHESQLRITNEEITSLVALELVDTGRIPLSNPQIWFTGGRIYMTGGAKPFGPIELNSIIVATAVVDNGQLFVEVQEAQMGAFDFPDAILESITQTINESLTSILIDLDITRLEILEGEMYVVGVRAV